MSDLRFSEDGGASSGGGDAYAGVADPLRQIDLGLLGPFLPAGAPRLVAPGLDYGLLSAPPSGSPDYGGLFSASLGGGRAGAERAADEPVASDRHWRFSGSGQV